MKSLNEDIKTGNFKPVYLLYGEEAYLKKQYRDRITKAIFPDGDTVNYAYYEGKGINPGELIDLAETMPFFADRCHSGGKQRIFQKKHGRTGCIHDRTPGNILFYFR